MNVKRFILASLAVFVVSQIVGFIIHGLILDSAYQATASLWRPEAEMNSMMWIMWVGGLIYSLFFTCIFTKGYEGKGIGEGLRYGFLMGCLISVPMSFSMYVTQPFPFGLAVSWLVCGIISMMIQGIVVAAVYKPNGQ